MFYQLGDQINYKVWLSYLHHAGIVNNVVIKDHLVANLFSAAFILSSGMPLAGSPLQVSPL